MEIFFPRIAEGRKAGRASEKKTAPPPPLSSRSGSATDFRPQKYESTIFLNRLYNKHQY